MPLRPGSKIAFILGWQGLAINPLSADACERYAGSPLPYNVGIALGYRGLVICDRDTDDERVRDALRPVFASIYARGGVPVAKFGSKGLTSFFRWIDAEPFRNRSFESSELGTFLELSGAGRSTTLPWSVHPDTGKTYNWKTTRTLLDTCVDELPTWTAADVRAIEAAIAPFLPPPKPPALIRPRVSVSELGERERERQARYALAIIDGELPALAAMPENSGRNLAAFRLACRVGKWVHHGILDQHRVVEPIMHACEANGLVRDTGRNAVLKTISSGLARAANDTLPDLRAQLGGRR
jgi:hypothetical protein